MEAAATCSRSVMTSEAFAIRISHSSSECVVRLISLLKAESVYISKLKENTSPEIAGQIVISQKYIDGMKTITSNPSDKVFLPNNFQGMFEISTNKK